MKVAWIGLGQIGEPMALRVLGAGHRLIGHVRGDRPRPALAAAGARFTTSVAEAVAEAEVICVGLFSDAQVTEVFGAPDVMAALAPGAVVAIHTTGVPRLLEDLSAGARPDVSLLDATFSGTAQDAAQGRIRLFVGGEAAALAKARPVLSTYCDPILPVGALGAARRLKLINNLLFAAQVSLGAEALRAVESMGVPVEVALQALSISSGSSFALAQFARGPVDQVLAGLQRYLDKDVEAARDAARAEGIDVSLLSATALWGEPQSVAG